MTVLFTETFTGSNGSAWSGTNWTAGTGTASATIQTNAGQMTGAAGLSSQRIQTSFITGNSGAFDFTFDFNISDITNSYDYFIELNGYYSGDDRYELYYQPNNGGVGIARVLAFTYTYPGSGTLACSVSDVVHNRVIRNPATGQLDWYMWLNGGSQPGSPTCSITDTTINADKIGFGTTNGTYVTTFDNITVNTVAAPTPAPDYGYYTAQKWTGRDLLETGNLPWVAGNLGITAGPSSSIAWTEQNDTCSVTAAPIAVVSIGTTDAADTWAVTAKPIATATVTRP